VLDELELQGAASIATTPFRARALVSDEALKRKTVNPAPTPTNEVKEVERLGLHAAGLPPKAFRALDVVGIRTIGAFMALPSSSLARRFGHEVYTLWRQAHDLERWPLPPHSPEKMLQETYRCDEAMHGLDPLCFCIKMLLDRALSRLNGRGQGIETLSLEFTLDTAYEALDPDPEQLSLLTGGSSTVLRRPERTHRITLSLGHPKQDPVLLLQLIRSRLNQHSPSGPVLMVSLQIEQATSLQPRQLDLFGDPEPLETIQTTVARLAAALGVQCFTPRLREDYRPERAWEMSTLEQKPPAAAPPPGPRPTRLLRTPTPLNRFGDNHEPPGALKGPERLVTGWWDSDPIARDYWVISDRWGRRSWVFRDIATSSWFLHGYFD
jgi:protein ImuB